VARSGRCCEHAARDLRLCVPRVAHLRGVVSCAGTSAQSCLLRDGAERPGHALHAVVQALADLLPAAPDFAHLSQRAI